MNQLQAAFATRGLVRPRDNRILGGVCSGIGRRLGVGPWVVRIVFLVACVLLPGSQLLVYPILWWLMPQENGGAVSSTVTMDQPPTYQDRP